MSAAIIVFAYNRPNSLRHILRNLRKSRSHYITHVYVISNGSHLHRNYIEAFQKYVNITFIAKRGSLDESVLIAYDLAKSTDVGWIYMCGDDDLPSVGSIDQELSCMENDVDIPLIISEHAPLPLLSSHSFLKKRTCFTYPEMLLGYLTCLPLGSFLLNANSLKLCSREVVAEGCGTWHAYSLIAFEAAYQVWRQDPNRTVLRRCTQMLRKPVAETFVDSSDEGTKTYKIDHAMYRNIVTWYTLIDWSPLSMGLANEQIKAAIRYVKSWIRT